MQKVTNKHKAPLVVTDATGKRRTIAPGLTFQLEGDFTENLFVKRGWLSVAEVATDDATDTDIAALRAQYEALLGKKAPSAAKAATLQKAVDEALAAQQASGTAESGENAADDSGGADATGTE